MMGKGANAKKPAVSGRRVEGLIPADAEFPPGDCIKVEGEQGRNCALLSLGASPIAVVTGPFARRQVSSLEQELQHELNQARVHRTDGNLAEIIGRRILGCERRIVYRVERKLWVVEGVEEFAPELQRLAFLDVKKFRNGHVPVILPR